MPRCLFAQSGCLISLYTLYNFLDFKIIEFYINRYSFEILDMNRKFSIFVYRLILPKELENPTKLLPNKCNFGIYPGMLCQKIHFGGSSSKKSFCNGL